MKSGKIFTNGRSQAVRLPKDCRFSGEDVYIKKFENIVILIPKDDPWAALIDSLDHFTKDFMNNRNQPKEQSRESIWSNIC